MTWIFVKEAEDGRGCELLNMFLLALSALILPTFVLVLALVLALLL